MGFDPRKIPSLVSNPLPTSCLVTSRVSFFYGTCQNQNIERRWLKRLWLPWKVNDIKPWVVQASCDHRADFMRQMYLPTNWTLHNYNTCNTPKRAGSCPIIYYTRILSCLDTLPNRNRASTQKRTPLVSGELASHKKRTLVVSKTATWRLPYGF